VEVGDPADLTDVIAVLNGATSPARVGLAIEQDDVMAKLARHFVIQEEVRPEPEFAPLALMASTEEHLHRWGQSSPDRAPISPPRLYANLGVVFGTVDRAGREALAGESAVSLVVPAPEFQATRPVRVAAAALVDQYTWGIESLRIPELWDAGFSGAGILIGHLDTGVDGSHEALLGAISSFVVVDDDGVLVADPSAPFDTEEHGTHTAGTIAGRPVDGRHIGVAPEALLASAVVIEGGKVRARILGGLDWAVGQGVRIVNLSLGLPGFVTNFITIMDILRARGVLPVAAVGNEGIGTSRSPGNYQTALSVGAHDRQPTVPRFSSSQSILSTGRLAPDLVAPGVRILSAGRGSYLEMDGSSMAAPHLSGLAALLMQAVPEAEAAQVEQAIFASCMTHDLPHGRANRGIPNAVAALERLRQISS
jgi:subtilisin family serine protease